MTLGPGKYDELCTLVRKKAKAMGVIVIVLGGEKGSGFSVQGEGAASEVFIKLLPELLRDVASQIEGDVSSSQKPWKKCAADQPSSYEIAEGGKAIIFRPCGVTSPHPEDIRHHFCAYCDRFIEKAHDPESHLG